MDKNSSIDQVSKNIQKRENPNDVFYTPIDLVKTHLEMVKPLIQDGVIYDPFFGTGNYYNEYINYFPNCDYEYSEITMGKDFFLFDKKVDAIVSNPPYSMINKVLEKCVELKPKIISFLLAFHNITPKRLKYMEQNGYGVKHFHLTKVYSWYGYSVIITFEKGVDSCISCGNTVYHGKK
jgi:hypothetical protein